MNKNILIALGIIIILGLGYWWWSNEQAAPAVEAVPEENGVKINGEVQGTWEETGKDGGVGAPL
jgi:cytoskeletal protein RodZ